MRDYRGFRLGRAAISPCPDPGGYHQLDDTLIGHGRQHTVEHLDDSVNRRGNGEPFKALGKALQMQMSQGNRPLMKTHGLEHTMTIGEPTVVTAEAVCGFAIDEGEQGCHRDRLVTD